MEWNYADGYVDIFMPSYIPDALHQLGHTPTKCPQCSPHKHIPITCGTKGTRQCATAPDTAPLLSPKEIKFIQSVTGSFLYCGLMLDSTILPALNEIVATQSQPTKKTQQKAQRLMDYLNTHPNAHIRYYASDMILHVDAHAAQYLIAPKAQSRVMGYFHLPDHPNITKHPKRNGEILIECKILHHVVSSAAEAEVAGIYHNTGVSIPIRQFLTALGHPQPSTPIKTNNSTATGFVCNNIHQKQSKHGTCNIIGYGTDKLNNNLICSGTKAPTMRQIISLNITQLSITELNARNTSRTN